MLSAAGAEVEVYAVEPCEDLSALAAAPPRGPIVIHRRGWNASDMRGAALAVAACENDDEAAHFAAAARAAGVPVNVIDKPKFCDFSFGAIVNRSPLVIGISTDGAAPVFAQAIRAKLEALIPRGFARWAEAARRWRQQVQASGLSFNGRRRFWQVFTAFAVKHPDHEPAQPDYDRLLARDRGRRARRRAWISYLGRRRPRRSGAAHLARGACAAVRRRHPVRRSGVARMSWSLPGARPERCWSARPAMALLQAKRDQRADGRRSPRRGRRVVRLKGGDPMIFGRASEEIEACRKARVAVEVVPGITAAQGAASRLGVSLTQRQAARRVQYITGHGADGALPDDIDWRSLADPAATSIIYMPVRTLGELTARAITAGLDPATPAVAVARATRPDEARIVSTVAELPERLAEAGLPGPVVVMIGRAFEGLSAAKVEHDPMTRPRVSLP